jgi:2-succinyl-5-enolpyruvyl-6-hydroxy-3-cyclohexene-1-carboxylate synthase
VETSSKDPNSIGCRDLVAGFLDAGVTRAFISPGSRNTPLTLAIAASDDITDISVRDERSAGFMALGWAKTTGRPAVVVCTSGSAATHYFPAVVEANHAAVPMIVVTADRPIALRGTSAPQTMDQANLYGSHVKAFIDLDIEHAGVRQTGEAVALTALSGIPGPVHVNIPFGEPLTPAHLMSAIPKPASEPADSGGRSTFDAHDHISPEVAANADSVRSMIEGKKVLVVAGAAFGPEYTSNLGRYAQELGAPLFADPQCRADTTVTIGSADILASEGMLDAIAPDVVLRLGGIPTSKSVWTWLEGCGIPQILVNRSRLTDPLGSAETVLDISAAEFVSQVPDYRADRNFLDLWRAVDAAAQEAMTSVINGKELSEPLIARTVIASVESGSVVFVGSSMPIRDVDAFAAPRSGIRIIANRGVSGIDGSISTAIGCALSGTPTTALIGDVAALHDATALSEAMKLGVPLRVVVVNNDGGGIFSFLPQGRSGVVSKQLYEQHWGTPHGLSLTRIAAAMEVPSEVVDSVATLTVRLKAPTTACLIEVSTERDRNVALHDEIRRAASSVLTSFR